MSQITVQFRSELTVIESKSIDIITHSKCDRAQTTVIAFKDNISQSNKTKQLKFINFVCSKETMKQL